MRKGLSWLDPRLCLVLAVALAARVWVLLDVLDAPFWNVPIVDELAYLLRAREILAASPPPYGAHFAAPGYAWILSLVLRVGAEPIVLKYLQLALGVLNAGLVYRLSTRIFSVRVGIIAGLAWALYPSALFHELLLLKPTLAVFWSLLALNLLVGGRSSESPSPWAVLGAGLALGLGALLRGEMLVVTWVLALSMLWRTWRQGTWRMGMRSAAILVVAQLLIVAIPTVQNATRGGGFVVLAYGGGVNFYIGNHAGADGSYLPLIRDRSDARVEERDAVELARVRSGQELNAAGVSRWWAGQGLAWWRADPMAALALSMRKLLLLWGPTEISDVLSREIAGRWVLLLRNPLLSARLLLPLSLIGLVLSWRRGQAWTLRAYLLATQLALLPFFLFERFRLPMLAVAAVPLAAYALVEAWDALRSRNGSALLRGALVLVVLGIVLALPRLDRDETVLRVNVGSLYLSAGRYTEALQEFDAVRREQPKAWRVEMNIAATYAAMGRSQDALHSLQRVLEKLYEEGRTTGRPVQQEIVQCHELAGDLLARQGRFAEAEAQFKAALEVAGHQPRLQSKRDEAARLAAGVTIPESSP